MEKETSGSHTGLIVSSVALLAAMLYFLAPAFLVAPFLYAEARGLIGPSCRGVIFAPIAHLQDRSPAYAALITRETTFCRELGLFPQIFQ
jgi:hypothetical protein